MNRGKLVFAQLMQHLPLTTFRRCVTRYRGAFKVKSFSCQDQFLCMAFAQLTYRESLRDIEVCLRAQRPKLYHLGIRSSVARNTLANANAVHDRRIFKSLKQLLRVKTFVGTSANALKTQIWAALIAMLLVKYLQLRSTFGWSLSNLCALLRQQLFVYRDLFPWLDDPFQPPPALHDWHDRQLLLEWSAS